MKNLIVLCALVFAVLPAHAIRLEGESSADRAKRFDWEHAQRSQLVDLEAGRSADALEKLLTTERPTYLLVSGRTDDGHDFSFAADRRKIDVVNGAIVIPQPDGEMLRILASRDPLDRDVVLDFIQRLDAYVQLRVMSHIVKAVEIVDLPRPGPRTPFKLEVMLRAFEQRPDVLRKFPMVAERLCGNLFKTFPPRPARISPLEIGL